MVERDGTAVAAAATGEQAPAPADRRDRPATRRERRLTLMAAVRFVFEAILAAGQEGTTERRHTRTYATLYAAAAAQGEPDERETRDERGARAGAIPDEAKVEAKDTT